MDLRDHIRTPADIAEAKMLISQTNFTYQPFRITDDLEVGGGYEFIRRKPGAGLVYWPEYQREAGNFAGPPIKTVDPGIKQEFTAANEALRRIYDGFVDQICEQIEDIHLKSVADIGCFNGYMPVSFARRGAREAIGYDQDDRSGCFDFLNRILGTNARFIHAGYDLASGTMQGCPGYDVVISMSVLQHIAEPFRHLHFLRSITHGALFLVTNVWSDDDYVVRYGEPNMIFTDASFPWCFDNSVYLSEPLLRKALEMAGFTRIRDLEIRLPASEAQAETPGAHDYAAGAGHAKSLTGRALLCFVDSPAHGAQADLRLGYAHNLTQPEERRPKDAPPVLLGVGYRGYNIVSYDGQYWGLNQAFGHMDLTSRDDRERSGVLTADSFGQLRDLIDAAATSPWKRIRDAGHRLWSPGKQP